MRRQLSGSGFQVVFDINGRDAVEAEPILDGLAGRGGSLEQYIYCSSAGVYLKSDMMPHREEDAVDPKSRHKVRFFYWDLLPPSAPHHTTRTDICTDCVDVLGMTVLSAATLSYYMSDMTDGRLSTA